MEFTKEQKADLINLARDSITTYLKSGKKPDILLEEIPEEFRKKRASFVTLELEGELRGCIGSLIPTKPLYEDIMDNSINAATGDPRFPALGEDEVEHIDIEISVLSIPKVLEHSDSKDLLDKLKSGKHGVILSKQGFVATFLPQVWEQLPDKEDFLSNLCLKADLPAEEWKKKVNIQVYTVDSFKESELL